MAKKFFSPADTLVDLSVRTQEHVYQSSDTTYIEPCDDQDKHILVCIFSDNTYAQNRALRLLQRDMQSHLIDAVKKRHAVCAQLRTLENFSASECLSFYHYHLQRTLGPHAQVWLSTKGGQV